MTPTPYRLPDESLWEYAERRREEYIKWMLGDELWEWLGEDTEEKRPFGNDDAAT